MASSTRSSRTSHALICWPSICARAASRFIRVGAAEPVRKRERGRVRSLGRSHKAVPEELWSKPDDPRLTLLYLKSPSKQEFAPGRVRQEQESAWATADEQRPRSQVPAGISLSEFLQSLDADARSRASARCRLLNERVR